MKADQDGVRERRLGAELRRLRERSGHSGRELAELVGISQSKVSRIESGTTLPTAPEVVKWAEATAATAGESQLLTMLTDRAYTTIEEWTDPVSGQPRGQDAVLTLENEAVAELNYQPSVIPGLLQTAEYARRLFTLLQPRYTKDGIARQVAQRQDRQLKLYDTERRFEFLITEAALRLRIGPLPSARMMAGQFDRITSLSTLDNVSVGLIPADAPALTIVSHGFVILEFAQDGRDTTVLAEAVHVHQSISKPEHVALYQQHWGLLKKQAVSGPDASHLFETIVEDRRKADQRTS